MIKETFEKRFKELELAFGQLKFVRNNELAYVPKGEWLKWTTSAQHLIVACFGTNSVHANSFAKVHAGCHGYESDIYSLRAIFQSAQEDFLGGYAFNIEVSVSGEIFGDFIRLARQSLMEGHKDVAAVLASAALEDALKRYATMNGIVIHEITMQEVINALKSKGLVAGAQKSIIDSMPKIRNAALHADWNKITDTEVGSILGFVEQFVLKKFSPDY